MIAGLRHVIRRRAERLAWPGGRAAVLLYHRVADETSDPYGLCVSPAQFEEHLQAIRDVGRPMPLDDLVHALTAGAVPEHAIAVTFDDGYLDNAEAALPLLEKYDVPATVFATTGPGGREREFWWDELERVFLEPGQRPGTLELRLGAATHRWDVEAGYSREEAGAHGRWHLFEDDPPTARHAVFREVYDLLRPLSSPERTAAMAVLLGWAGLASGDVRLSRRTMTPERMATVDADGLLRIEAHTVNHPALPAQSDADQQAEVAGAKRTLEEWLGRPVTGFAYPYGAHDERAVSTVREAGLAYACACTYRSVWSRSDRFALPRLEAPARDGDVLTELLRWQLR